MRYRHLIDAFAFSSLLPAVLAFLLSWTTSLLLVAPSPWRWATLASLGTLVVYNVDRLRDTARDRATSPDRTAFVERFRGALTLALSGSAIVLAVLLAEAPSEIIGVTIAIGLIGLFHRRMKGATAWKALYVSIAWTTVCAGIPWLAARRPEAGLWIMAIFMFVLGANLIASNLQDDEFQLFSARPKFDLRTAIALAASGACLTLAAPDALRPLFWIAIAEALAILGFRRGERYGLLVIDGALLVGAAVALIDILLLHWLG